MASSLQPNPVSSCARRPGVIHGANADSLPSSGRTALVVSWLSIVVVSSYWPILIGLYRSWQSSEDYSAGLLVPLVAVFFIWRERRVLQESTFVPCWRAGIPLLLFAQAARLYGFFSYRFSLERYSLMLTLGAFALLIAGRQFLLRIAWILLFLFLMFPLPGRVHSMVSAPLQGLATTGSVFLLEAVGVPVSQQGNIILLKNEIPMAVAEACSGLRMLTAFIIVAAFIAYMVKRPRWHKAILLASSIPVAVACNIIRIFLTAMIMLYVSVELGEHFFHDFAGLVMMPAAVSLIFGEIWLLDRIVTPDEKESSSPSDANSKSGGQPVVIHAKRVAK